GRTVAIATVLVLAVAAGTAVAGRNGLLPLGGSCADEAVRVDVVAAPDIAPALRQAATHIRDKEVTSDGHCMDVRVTPRDAYQVAEAAKILASRMSDSDSQVLDTLARDGSG
ncbi:von Willebrand factor, partial [Streptomyces sp. NRRL F-6602]